MTDIYHSRSLCLKKVHSQFLSGAKISAIIIFLVAMKMHKNVLLRFAAALAPTDFQLFRNSPLIATFGR